MKELGKLTARLRNLRGIKTQKAFATAVGKDSSWVSHLEKGTLKVTPDPELLSRMSDVLGVSQKELLIAAGYDIGGHEDDTEVVTIATDDPRARILRAVMDLPDDEVERWANAITAWESTPDAS